MRAEEVSMPVRVREQQGQGAIEYALLLVLIAIILIAVLSLLGQSIFTVFYGIGEALQFQCGAVSRDTFRSYAGEGGEALGSPALAQGPTLGKVTQRYWFCHNGWDIANDAGTPVYAVADGVVRFAGLSDRGYGYMAVIDHGSYQTLYAHFKGAPSVGTGQTVSAGTVVGLMGSTGFSTGPHLHFEIRHGSELVDPGPHIP
jgi:murein DD-endopeptidase MepM/ murein hydrolase activator NlpD